MKLKRSLAWALLSSLPATITADCQLKNTAVTDGKSGTVETNWDLCKPQGEGDWTFSMILSDRDFPTFSSGSPWAGYTSSAAFAIYDNTCALRGSYNPDQDNECGVPYVIEENFLTQVLGVQSVNFSPAAGYFSFTYGDGLYSIRNNQCGCASEPDGLVQVTYCKCGFPVNGHFNG